MIDEELNLRIRFLLGKARNLVYYASIDTRPRVTYIHVVRGLRKNLKEVLASFPTPEPPEYQKLHTLFLEIIRSIDSKIQAPSCKKYILETLKPILELGGII